MEMASKPRPTKNVLQKNNGTYKWPTRGNNHPSHWLELSNQNTNSSLPCNVKCWSREHHLLVICIQQKRTTRKQDAVQRCKQTLVRFKRQGIGNSNNACASTRKKINLFDYLPFHPFDITCCQVGFSRFIGLCQDANNGSIIGCRCSNQCNKQQERSKNTLHFAAKQFT